MLSFLVSWINQGVINVARALAIWSWSMRSPLGFKILVIFQDKSKDSKANPLSVKNIGGVFVVLLCGLALAIIVAVLEFCWNSKKNSQIDHQSLCSEMAEELRFAMRCRGSRQKPALRRSCSRY